MSAERLERAVEQLAAHGVVSVRSFAWRDRGDPDGGGSELHADEILARWAAAGLDVEHRTSVPRVGGTAERFQRRGYRVVRRGGRFDVFARVVAEQLFRRTPPDTAVLEIWNGVPFLSPLWAGPRRLVWVHHLHRHMWADVLPRPLAAVGRFGESRLAPPVYRRTAVATLSESSAAELRDVGLRDLTVIPPGIDAAFVPDPARRSTTPRLVVVGRLAPVKRQRVALEAARRVRDRYPDLEVDVIGDGPDRPAVEAWIAEHDAASWVHLRGFVGDDELVQAYQEAWLVVSASKAEGWGMSLTEAAACGTPSVATDIAGHRGSAVDGVTGLLVRAGDTDGDDALAAGLGRALDALLGDADRRSAMTAAAIDHGRSFSWDDVAARQLELLVAAVSG